MLRSTYLVKEIFGPTLQGEGAHAGRACVFLRFAGCNLACDWCDTDFSAAGTERLDREEVAARLQAVDRHGARLVIVTGGEPALQWNQPLADALRAAGFRIHMETNGTRPLRGTVDWLTVSPKPRFHGAVDRLVDEVCARASECKVVADDHVDAATLVRYEELFPNARYFVQPCAAGEGAGAAARAIALVTANPRWQLSLQLHKLLGLP